MTLTSLTDLDAYRRMLTIRRVEERVLALSREGLVAGSIHLCGGQEAVAVGACAALTEADRVLTTYRGHGWAIARGVPLDSIIAEICHRSGGANGGRGGSAHFSSARHGFLGENSIVGAGVPIAAGVALALTRRGTDGVAVVSIGDGATNQGATHEGLAFAAARDLPMVVVIENNGWSEMTPISATARVERLAERAAGYGIIGVSVDGTDAHAVHNAVAEAVEACRRGLGPRVVECDTVRLMAHYNGDVEHYRTEADRAADRERDPLQLLGSRLAAEPEAIDLDAIEREIATLLDAMVQDVLQQEAPDVAEARSFLFADSATHVVPAELASRQLTFAEAVNDALQTELADRPEMILYGEDIAIPGGVFGVTKGLHRRFGDERVFDTPIAESAILGSALGAATQGLRPVVEIMWGDFALVALDQIVNQVANAHYVSRGELRAPLVVRMQQGATPGSCAQHSQSLEAIYAHVPGLRVGLPSTPQDAYSMLRAAIASDDPCIIIEARSLYRTKGSVLTGGVVESVGGARLRREGKDYGIITWGSAASVVEAAVEELDGRGCDVGVLDLRWLSPLDDAAMLEFVRASGGRIAIVHEANVTGGFGAEIAARLTARCFDTLTAPIERIGAADTRIPASPALQQAVLPTVTSVVARMVELIEGSTSTTQTSMA